MNITSRLKLSRGESEDRIRCTEELGTPTASHDTTHCQRLKLGEEQRASISGGRTTSNHVHQLSVELGISGRGIEYQVSNSSQVKPV